MYGVHPLLVIGVGTLAITLLLTVNVTWFAEYTLIANPPAKLPDESSDVWELMSAKMSDPIVGDDVFEK